MSSAAIKKNFVLVHGAWRGGWCWRRVADLLAVRGHEVFTPTLTGLGERAHLLSDAVNLSTHIEDVVRLIECEDLDRIVLVGHSYGGMVVSGVAERVEARIASIAIVDGFVPEDGMSLSDYWPADRRAVFEGLAAATGGKSLPPITAAAFGVNKNDQAWVDAKCVPHPYATFTEKIRLTGAVERIAKKSYVRAANHPSVYFSAFLAKLKTDPSWRTYELPCGHDVMIDMPNELAAIFEEAA